jgi:hypothetical protein
MVTPQVVVPITYLKEMQKGMKNQRTWLVGVKGQGLPVREKKTAFRIRQFMMISSIWFQVSLSCLLVLFSSPLC